MCHLPEELQSHPFPSRASCHNELLRGADESSHRRWIYVPVFDQKLMDWVSPKVPSLSPLRAGRAFIMILSAWNEDGNHVVLSEKEVWPVLWCFKVTGSAQEFTITRHRSHRVDGGFHSLHLSHQLRICWSLICSTKKNTFSAWIFVECKMRRYVVPRHQTMTWGALRTQYLSIWSLPASLSPPATRDSWATYEIYRAVGMWCWELKLTFMNFRAQGQESRGD